MRDREAHTGLKVTVLFACAAPLHTRQPVRTQLWFGSGREGRSSAQQRRVYVRSRIELCAGLGQQRQARLCTGIERERAAYVLASKGVGLGLGLGLRGARLGLGLGLRSGSRGQVQTQTGSQQEQRAHQKHLCVPGSN